MRNLTTLLACTAHVPIRKLAQILPRTPVAARANQAPRHRAGVLAALEDGNAGCKRCFVAILDIEYQIRKNKAAVLYRNDTLCGATSKSISALCGLYPREAGAARP